MKMTVSTICDRRPAIQARSQSRPPASLPLSREKMATFSVCEMP